jgi:hypothetical protein
MTAHTARNLRWRYLLEVHVPGTEGAILRDALEGEAFGLRERLGAEELERQIAGFEIRVDRVSPERWDDFADDLKVLSLYLTSPVEGSEISIADGGDGPELHGARIVAHRGEVVTLDIDVAWDDKAQTIVVGDERRDALEKRWPTLPEWIKTAMRRKHRDLGL